VLLVFAICAVPVHIWAFIALFRAIPSWILSMTVGEMAGIMAYPLAFALLESLLLLLGLVIAAAILPAKMYRDWFVSQSAGIVLLATAWAVFMQIYGADFRLWSSRGIFGLIPLIASILLFSFLNIRYPNLRKTLESIAGRLVILGVLYLLVDVVFLVVLIVRNL
jgi:hypothetical protein